MVVLFATGILSSVAFRQYLLLQGGKASFRQAPPILVPLAQTAQNLLEGPPHVIVSEAVDDRIDKRVALRQHQDELLVDQHLTGHTLQTVEQQQNQAGCPADHEQACQERQGGTKDCQRSGNKKQKVSLVKMKRQFLGGGGLNPLLETTRQAEHVSLWNGFSLFDQVLFS